MKKSLLTILLILYFSVNAQVFKSYSNEFLNIGVDAATLAMGKSAVAITNDVNATYWNPAGLIHIKDYQGSLMHTSYFAGIANYNFAAFAMPLDDKSAIGLSIIRFAVDDILNTTNLIDNQGNINYNKISLFSASDYAFNISYAKNIFLKDLYIGGNTKIIRRIIGDFASSWGFGFDLGLQFERNNWSFGLMVRDITTTFNSWSINNDAFDKIKNAVAGENQELPQSTEITKPKLQAGVARRFDIGRYYHLLTSFDLNMRFAQTNDIISSSFMSISPSVGMQLDFDDIVFLRVGANNFQYITNFDNSKSISVQPNLGVGFKYKGIYIDYALTNVGNIGNALYSNVFSIKIDYQFFRP